MDFFNKIKGIISKPKDFFTKIKKEKGIKNTFIYFLIFASITTFLSTIYFYRAIPRINIPEVVLTPQLIFLIMVVLYILILFFSIVAVFVSTGITHLFVLLMKGKKGFYQTFKAMIYGETPKYLLSILLSPITIIVYPKFFGMKPPFPPELTIWFIITIIPGIIVAIYTIYLKTIGIKKLQEISTLRAFSAIFLLPIALFIVIYLIFFVITLSIAL